MANKAPKIDIDPRSNPVVRQGHGDAMAAQAAIADEMRRKFPNAALTRENIGRFAAGEDLDDHDGEIGGDQREIERRKLAAQPHLEREGIAEARRAM